MNYDHAPISRLTADGWEPIVDPQNGKVTAMKREK